MTPFKRKANNMENFKIAIKYLTQIFKNTYKQVKILSFRSSCRIN